MTLRKNERMKDKSKQTLGLRPIPDPEVGKRAKAEAERLGALVGIKTKIPLNIKPDLWEAIKEARKDKDNRYKAVTPKHSEGTL